MKIEFEQMEKLEIKGLNYEPKILLAWGECIDGNEKITQWLMKNGYAELGLFRYALRNEERSRVWLMENGFPHLMALINGIEGKKDALEWLEKHGFYVLHQMALVGDGDEDAENHLLSSGHKLFALLAKKMEFIKDGIQADNIDYHKINRN
ncbi:MAG: hypothetical protein Salg2KO_22740 [Salibacteraceae bacterium]